MELLEQVQRWEKKLIRALERLPYEDRLRKLDLFSLDKKVVWGPHSTFQYLEGPFRGCWRGTLFGNVVTGQGVLGINLKWVNLG